MGRLNKLMWTTATTYYIHSQFLTIGVISGPSMAPTFNPENSIKNDLVLILRNPATLNRKDIAFIKHPNNPSTLLVKRIKGLQGDIITPRRLTRHASISQENITVPEGFAWVEGDEPYVGVDSNQLGSVPLGLVVGKVVCILYPFNRFTIF